MWRRSLHMWRRNWVEIILIVVVGIVALAVTVELVAAIILVRQQHLLAPAPGPAIGRLS